MLRAIIEDKVVNFNEYYKDPIQSHLDLSNQGLTDRHMDQLVIFLKANPQITSLDLSRNHIISEDPIMDLVIRKINGDLLLLKWDKQNNLDNAKYKVDLIALFVKKTQGDFLDLSWSPPDFGKLFIFDMLRHSADLSSFDMVYLVEYLKENPQITSLDLSRNAIKDKGAIILSSCSSLTKLNLNNNYIEDAGIAAIARMPLVELSIRGNNFTELGLATFANNTTLTSLGLENADGILSLTASSLTARYSHFDINKKILVDANIADRLAKNCKNRNAEIKLTLILLISQVTKESKCAMNNSAFSLGVELMKSLDIQTSREELERIAGLKSVKAYLTSPPQVAVESSSSSTSSSHSFFAASSPIARAVEEKRNLDGLTP